MQKFQFNTGVRYSDYPYLVEGQELSGDVKVIPFYCEDVPERASFKYACDDPDLHPDDPNIIVREIYNSKLISKYAYFILPPDTQ